MKTAWDYTELASAYVKRPDYVEEAIDRMLDEAHLNQPGTVCDVGAGAAHLTKVLAKKGHRVYAVEPNPEMRRYGEKITSGIGNIFWYEGVGEDTGMKTGYFDLVTFGSSFNVCDQQSALKETHRILKPNGYIACMWNHRDLEEPLQKDIERTIKASIPKYDYGSRRKDQTKTITQSGLFQKVTYIEASALRQISANDFTEGWKSHATLQRQSKENFYRVIEKIKNLVDSYSKNGMITVPYTTRIWLAQRTEG